MPAPFPPPPRHAKQEVQARWTLGTFIVALIWVLCLGLIDLRGRGRFYDLAFILAALLVGILFFRWMRARRERPLLEHGEVTRGKLLAVGGTIRNRRVEYEFLAADGTLYNANHEASRTLGWEEGEPVTVFYDPENPKNSVAYEFSLFEIEGMPG